MKICVPVLSRQAAGRLHPLIAHLRREHLVEVLVGGAARIGQYGDVRETLVFDAELPYRPPDDTHAGMAIATSDALNELTLALNRSKPDLVIAHADRYETLAVAIAASYQNIRLAHIQGGERTGSIDDKVRFAVSMLADLHFTATKNAAQTLLDLHLQHVHNVGCPSIDLCPGIPCDINRYGTGHTIRGDYLLVVYHPDTTQPWELIAHELESLYAQVRSRPTVWMLPNIDAGNESVSKFLRLRRDTDKHKIRFVAHVPVREYLGLLNHCTASVGNSSSFLREGAFLGVPTVQIGHRQWQREAVNTVTKIPKSKRRFPSSHLYGDGRACTRILEILHEL